MSDAQVEALLIQWLIEATSRARRRGLALAIQRHQAEKVIMIGELQQLPQE